MSAAAVTLHVVLRGEKEDLALALDRALREQDGRMMFDFEAIIPTPSAVSALEGFAPSDYSLAVVQMKDGSVHVRPRQDLVKVIHDFFAGLEPTFETLLATLEAKAPGHDLLAEGRETLAVLEAHHVASPREWRQVHWGVAAPARDFAPIRREEDEARFRITVDSNVPVGVLRAFAARNPRIDGQVVAHESNGLWGAVTVLERGVARTQVIEASDALAFIMADPPNENEPSPFALPSPFMPPSPYPSWAA